MKKLLLLIMACVLALCVCPSSAEEAQSPYPFGIQLGAVTADVLSALESTFGEFEETSDHSWVLKPEGVYLYDFEVYEIDLFNYYSMLIENANEWKLKFNLRLRNQNSSDAFLERLTNLYLALKETNGEVVSISPESYTYDLSGAKKVRVYLEDAEELKKIIDNLVRNDDIFYECSWEHCSLSFSAIRTLVIDPPSYYIRIEWEGEYFNAPAEETAP